MLKTLYTRLTGDPNEKELNRLKPIVAQINALEPHIQKLTDAQLRAKTEEFRARLDDELREPRARVRELRQQFDTADTDTRRILEEQLKQAEKELLDAERAALDAILPEAFACVREASVRTIGLRHFDVQLIGGIVLHEGKIAEMKTGEGKTLVATLPLYLNALLGRGAHLVTVNDYLARRDTQWMGPIYHALGLSVAALQQGDEKRALMFDPTFEAATREMNFLRACDRHDAYRADITYGTNSEFGFDYLRDNMAWRLEDRVQRELYYAIVDEVDNILIDEARTPLIISGPAGEASEEYYRLAQIVRQLSPDHYTIDQRTRSITLTEAGYDRVEELLGQPLTNPDRPEEVDPQQAKLMHHLEAALKAEYLFKRDKDYIVRKGQVIIVDEFTGRLMPGRRWSDGLHQAVEAKEGVPIQPESVTYATITLQNYFRLYKRLAGMTGTAKTEEDELYKVYGLSVVVIPTNKPMIRVDQPDLVYRNEEAKWRAVTIEVAQTYSRGQPLLLGTTSVEQSERLSKRFSADKLDLFARAKLLQHIIETRDDLSDRQRTVLKLILSRSLDEPPENFEEALSSRLFHDYDLDAIADAARKMPVRDLLRAKQASKRAAQTKLSEKELAALHERDLRFAARLEERGLRLDGARALCDEIAAHPDDLTKIAPRFGLPLELAVAVYNDLRLSRDELNNVNRALIDSLGDVEAVHDEYRVRASDMDIIVKRLFLRTDDVLRLAKKLGVNADPLAPENADTTREIFGIENIEHIAKILREGIPHSVLNAKEHEKEAGIIARAGELHAVTVATNMAGRGVDIKLGGELREETLNQLGRILRRHGIDPYNLTFDQIAEALEKIPPQDYELDKEHVERFKRYMFERAKVRELGGLRVIGTERHEARRIDNQLRGRSGRQGDSGSSRFYVSLEDEIMRRMGGKGLMDRVWIEDIPIEHDWVTKAIEQAQVKMESYNFDIRKHLLEYDDVLNKQREIIYGQRYRILTKADLRDDVRSWFEEEIARILAENKDGDHSDARLLTYLDALMPGFARAENDLWPPYSLALVMRALGESPNAQKILDAAQRAMELHRDFLVHVIVPEVVQQFESEYRAKWDELEDLAKNTLTTLRQEAEEQQRALDARTATQIVSQAVGMQLSAPVERELNERAILDAVRRAFDARQVDQIARRVAKRANQAFEFRWEPNGSLNFDALRDDLATALEDAYTKQANRHLAEIEREIGEHFKSAEDWQGTRLAFHLFMLSHTRQTAFDTRTHRRFEVLVPRFPWVHLAATYVPSNREKLREEIVEYWNQSLEQLVPLRGGVEAFNDLLRELMLTIVSVQWVDYLTAIEALREGIGLQAFGQRDPLVEYKRRAFAMFQDLYARIRSQVVTYLFTYQYRGLTRLESAARDREARQAIAATTDDRRPTTAVMSQAPREQRSAVSSQRSAVGGQPSAVSGQRSAVGRPPVGQKLGRNDPCWCGSGKKYKNCHMQSDNR